MLLSLFFIPLFGAFSLFFVNNKTLIKQITLGSTIINFFISLILWGKFDNNSSEYQFIEDYAQISFCHLYVGVDAISLFFVLLTTFIFPIVILTSWEHKNNIKTLFINFLLLESLLITTFIVLDLLLFYIFFESILIPLFILIIQFGDLLTKEKAGFLLLLYTLAGSLFMLLSIITIFILTGTTDFQVLSTVEFGSDIQKLLFIGFLIAFIVKTPLFPTHIWLGFAHVAAPIGGSVLLAGVILKLATYLALRVMIPYFPEASLYFTPLIFTLAVISIIYASLTCLRLIDVKAIIAYSSVSHMGVVVLGLFSNNLQGLEGAVILGLAHGVISPLLFIIVGEILYVRSHTRIIKYYRGIASTMPILSLIFFFATLANIGTPFSGNFIGEFMSYAGAFQINPIITIIGATGMFLSAAYSIWLFNRMAFGRASIYMSTMPDVSRREFFVMLPLIIVSFILGVYPNIVLDALHLPLSSLLIGVNTPQGNDILLNFIPGLLLFKKNDSLSDNLLNLNDETNSKDKPNSFLNPDSIIIYSNADTEKSQILSENKGRAGIYMWTHKESGKIYIGSASNIKTRLLQYFNINYLERNKTMYICNSLKEHGYSAFSLTIFEIIDLTDLSKDSARKKILAREQYYLDKLLELELSNTFNISLTAGSSLGQVRSEETKVKMSEAKLGEKHPFFGKIHSVETKAKMSLSSGTKKKKYFFLL
jgi:NADH-ubiquinone oxidoreductase chain 4